MDRNYPIPENPEYNPNIPQIQNDDYVDAEAVLNPVLRQIIENQAAQWLFKADLVEGKIPAEQLPDMGYEVKGAAASAILRHNQDGNTHPDIRTMVSHAIYDLDNLRESFYAHVSEIFQTIAIPTQHGILPYSGSPQSPSWDNFDSNKMTISGDTTGTNAGTYTAFFTPKENYKWSNGSRFTEVVTWTISRAPVAVPTQIGILTYNGSVQSPSWKGWDSGEVIWSGKKDAVDVGIYNAIFTPDSNHQWTDGTTEDKTVQWRIEETSPTIESADFPSCYYRMVNGVQEWLNPPMVDGVEYRTTERYMGKVVYTKLVVFGALPDNGLKSVSIQPSGETPATYPIRGSLLIGMNETYQGTAIGNLYPGVTQFYTGTNNISIETNANLSSYSGRVQIWYTRS